MTDERAAEGVEHLQAAARELLAAARSFLDVVEDVVEDRARFADAATVVGEAVRDGLGLVGRRTGSWPAPESGEWPEDGGSPVTNARDDSDDAEVPEASDDAGVREAPDAPDAPDAREDAEVPESPGAATAPGGGTDSSRTSRVRRIPVD